MLNVEHLPLAAGYCVLDVGCWVLNVYILLELLSQPKHCGFAMHQRAIVFVTGRQVLGIKGFEGRYLAIDNWLAYKRANSHLQPHSHMHSSEAFIHQGLVTEAIQHSFICLSSSSTYFFFCTCIFLFVCSSCRYRSLCYSYLSWYFVFAVVVVCLYLLLYVFVCIRTCSCCCSCC